MFSFAFIMPQYKYKNVPGKPDHEIQDILDAIKAVKIENVPMQRAANTFKIDRSLLRRYITKMENAAIDIESAPNQQLFDFVSSLRTSGGKPVRRFD